MNKRKELPEGAYDLLIILWARSQGAEILSVRKTQKDEDKHD